MKDYEGSTIEWDWRKYFAMSTLSLGKTDAASGKLIAFECDPGGSWARGRTIGGFDVRVTHAPTTFEEVLEYPDWEPSPLSYGKPREALKRDYSCSCSQGSNGSRCRHLASLMIKWEQVHGPFVMTEDEQSHAARMRAIRERQAEIERKKQLELEKERKQAIIFPVERFLLSKVTPAPGHLFFSPDAILKRTELLTDQYEADIARELIESEKSSHLDTGISYEPGKPQILKASGRFGNRFVSIAIDRNSIVGLSCQCNHSRLRYNGFWYRPDQAQGRMCGHAMAAWMQLREAIIRDNPGDETDYHGFQLISILTGEAAAEPPAASPEEAVVLQKKPCVCLMPRITHDRDADTLKLNFDIGLEGGSRFAVKGLEGLVKAAENDQIYSVSKTLALDFSKQAFTEDTIKWFQLIQSRVRTVNNVNERLHSSSYYYASSTLSVGRGIPLEESDLDIVYDMSEGGTVQYQYGSRAEVCTVTVTRARPRVEITLSPIKTGEQLTGIVISGAMPRVLRGSLHQYVLDRTCFGRVTDNETSFLSTLKAVADATGTFRCVIGTKKLAEFYYRVLPDLQRNPQVTLIDKAGSLPYSLLPPEPQFTFFLDLTGSAVTCDVRAAYDDIAFALGAPQPVETSLQRDIDQEQRVLSTVQRFFPATDEATGRHMCAADDDRLVWILTEGVLALSKYGEVKGSDAFSRIKVLPTPQPRFSVALEGGLLDLSIKTRDMSEDELLELLASYRLKKRWHKLKSGDYVDLRNAEGLDILSDTVQAMDIAIDDLIRGGVRMPAFRALYVDRLLEAHNEIASSRNRQFKALVRSFQAIRDSDFEVSESLAEVLRPYQLYGFRWLSTLAQAGFGGILADEMGLGKTVQMLAYIQTRRSSGTQKPALVVCPASLVYNWKDECRKFTPELKAETIAGSLTQRRAMLRDLSADLYITSYDLLKRDITLYDGITFSTIVLDEAQFIKNQKAAISRAVRILKGETRFALTGTPIENRLSELWSIFDFLMPGFLYASSEFTERFEGPIMKQKDAAATAKLSQMTAPFILRRKKIDVLKDLPEKLEETRSTQMAEDQRQLYDAQLVHMKALMKASGSSGEDKMRILAEITRLRQLCCDPSLLLDDYHGTSAKRAACLELIQSAMDAGHRMLVFSQFTSMLSLLAADLRAAKIPFFTLTGATPKQERISLVNAFNEQDTPVFLISLKAGGTGLNLTGADVVIHYDPWWNLAVQNQATDRAHRIGQTRQVTVVKLIAADTIEEKIMQLQQTKRELADAIISGENTSLMSLSKEELMALLG